MKTLLITGTDTDVGKTYVSCLTVNQLRASGVRVGAWKPVCSGAVIDESGIPRWSDVDLLAGAVGDLSAKELICPQTFRAAVAPNTAAAMEGREVDETLIRQGPVGWHEAADVVIAEGAGGLLSPLSDNLSTADVAVQLAAPVIIVAANRLGMINHTLLTVEVAHQRGLTVAAVIVNDVGTDAGDLSQGSNVEQLNRRCRLNRRYQFHCGLC